MKTINVTIIAFLIVAALFSTADANLLSNGDFETGDVIGESTSGAVSVPGSDYFSSDLDAISRFAEKGDDNSSTATVSSAGIDNISTFSFPVPEPVTLLLLGAGLIGLSSSFRKKTIFPFKASKSL
jgi:hypothetical protein